MNDDKLHLAREAMQRSELPLARKLVAGVLLSDLSNERAWLMMARLVSDRGQVIECLERALKINPSNLAAAAALSAMKRKQPS